MRAVTEPTMTIAATIDPRIIMKAILLDGCPGNSTIDNIPNNPEDTTRTL
jgi:hypothetical protein